MSERKRKKGRTDGITGSVPTHNLDLSRDYPRVCARKKSNYAAPTDWADHFQGHGARGGSGGVAAWIGVACGYPLGRQMGTGEHVVLEKVCGGNRPPGRHRGADSEQWSPANQPESDQEEEDHDERPGGDLVQQIAGAPHMTGGSLFRTEVRGLVESLSKGSADHHQIEDNHRAYCCR
jgi:hypothetical protein